MSSYDLVKYQAFPADPILNLYLREAVTVPFPDEKISYSASVMHLFDYVFYNFLGYDLHKQILDSSSIVKIDFFRRIASTFLWRHRRREEKDERVQSVLYAMARNISAHRSRNALEINFGYSSVGSSEVTASSMHNVVVFLFEERQTTLKELHFFSDLTSIDNIPEARPIFTDMILLLSNQLEHLSVTDSLHACGISDSIGACTKLRQLKVKLFPLVSEPSQVIITPLVLPKSLQKLILTVSVHHYDIKETKEFATYFGKLHLIDEITLVVKTFPTTRILHRLLKTLRPKTRALTFTMPESFSRHEIPPTILRNDTDIKAVIDSLAK